MARQVRDERESPRASRGRKSASRPAHKKRISDDCHDERRFTVHSGTPRARDTALVYIFKDAEGLTKVGYSKRKIEQRMRQVNTIVPPTSRPIRLVRGVWMLEIYARKVERMTHFLLERQSRHAD